MALTLDKCFKNIELLGLDYSIGMGIVSGNTDLTDSIVGSKDVQHSNIGRAIDSDEFLKTTPTT